MGYKKTPREKEWVCPCHECVYCDKCFIDDNIISDNNDNINDNNNNNSNNSKNNNNNNNDISDNILYRCKYCPYSYCKDCIELVSEKTKFDPLLEKYFLFHNYTKHNFEIPTNIKWIICIECFEENKR